MAGIKKLDLQVKYEGPWAVATTIYRNKMYSIQVKVNNVDSFYGIKGGKILKLWIKNDTNNKVIFEYDRGFNVGTAVDLEKGIVSSVVYTIEMMCSGNDERKAFGLYRDWLRWIK